MSSVTVTPSKATIPGPPILDESPILRDPASAGGIEIRSSHGDGRAGDLGGGLPVDPRKESEDPFAQPPSAKDLAIHVQRHLQPHPSGLPLTPTNSIANPGTYGAHASPVGSDPVDYAVLGQTSSDKTRTIDGIQVQPDPVFDSRLQTIDARKQYEMSVKEEQEAIERAIAEEIAKTERTVPSLGDEDLDAMIRGMQKMVQNVHIAPPPYTHPEDSLDLVPSPDEEFTLDKLRSQLERFYSSIVFGTIRGGREIMRIRNWEEGGRRTRVALLVYIVAWFYGKIFTSFFIFLSLLVLHPPSRTFTFGPPSHFYNTSSQPRIPTDHLTVIDGPAPPGWGPAASEKQAAKWAEEMESTLVSLVTPGSSKGKGGERAEEKVEEEVNGVLVRNMKKRRGEGGGDEQEGKEDSDVKGNGNGNGNGNGEDMSKKEKKNMAKEVYGKPAIKIIGGLADKWERVANAINPTPPFVKPSRLRVFCTILLPAILMTLMVTPVMVSRSCGVIFGVLLFGKPVTDPAVRELDKRIPHWRQRLILEHNILADVPTNPQIVIRLLRDAEHKRRPLPHPFPLAEVEAKKRAKEKNGKENEDEDGDADGTHHGAKQRMGDMGKKVKSGVRSSLRKSWDKLGTMKEEGFAWVSGRKKVDYEGKAKITMNKLHISQESKAASAVLRKLPDGGDDPYEAEDGPSRFYVNHAKHGPGHLIIHPPILSTDTSTGTAGYGSASSSSSASPRVTTPARITFTTIRQVAATRNMSVDPQLNPVGDKSESRAGRKDLTISINDIIAMKKTGLGRVGKLAVSWALDVDGAGGTGLELTIVRRDKVSRDFEHGVRRPNEIENVGMPPSGSNGEPGGTTTSYGKAETVVLKSIVRRDELFDRLLAIGDQRWSLL